MSDAQRVRMINTAAGLEAWFVPRAVTYWQSRGWVVDEETPVPTPDPYPQYVTDEELADALAGVGGGGPYMPLPSGTAAVGQLLAVEQLSPFQAEWVDPPTGGIGTVVDPPTGVQATDTAAITAAVTEAGAGGFVQFRPGTYVAEGISPLSGQVWSGNDTVIARPSASAASVVSALGTDDITLRGLRFDGARATSPATSNPVVQITNAQRPRVVDCTFENTPVTNAGLILRGTVAGLIFGSRFRNVGYAALIGLNLGDAYACRDNAIVACTVDTTDWNAFFFTENLGSTSFSTTVAAASDGQTLPQATINVASTSGLPTSGRLRIGGYGGPVIAYTGKTSTTLTGCTVVSGAGTLATGQAVQIAVQGLVQGTVMMGCTLRGYGDCGVESGSGAVGTEITGNSFYGSAESNQSILFRDSRDSSATANTCAANSKSGGGTGIYIVNLNGHSERIQLIGNTVMDAAYCGIIAEGARELSIVGGLVTRSGVVGIRLRAVTGYLIDGVNVTRSVQAGLEIGQFNTNSATDGTVSGCRVMNNNQGGSGSGSGIVVYQSSTGIITGCRIGDDQAAKTQFYGVRIYDAAVAVDIAHNDLRGNATDGIQNFGAGALSRAFKNRGFNNKGVQGITIGASPFTYTAGLTPEVAYFAADGSSVSFTKDGLAISGRVFQLDPGESVVMTYTVAPTNLRVDRK